MYNIFTLKNIQIDAIWSRDIENAKSIDSSIATEKLDFSESKSTVFIICVPDNVIPSIVEELKIPNNAIITHTSGSTPINVINKFKNFGIFYPLQTFSKIKNVDFTTIPILLEANNIETLKKLKDLADIISKNVIDCDSEKRKKIHVAAVFACNFTNHLLSISENILKNSDLELSLLEPLVKETIAKSFEIGPINAQTGPAKRDDLDTIDKHIKLLNKKNSEVYRLLSDLIMKNK